MKSKRGVYIALGIILLVILASVTAKHAQAPQIDNDYATTTTSNSIENGDTPSTSTPATTPTTGNSSGGNDMNGSGNDEPSGPIQNTGLQSPILMTLYGKHIVGTTNSQIMINPWAVLEDSRCPIDVQCIWAGRARVGIHFYNPSNNTVIQDAILEVGQSVTIGGIQITLLQVSPSTLSTHKIKDSEYRFTFDITR